ncbi:MAG TPA: CRTAC1 family protein [Blastocatellia bacterium]|nr:CRTAC1 family protein [Blastocatellia bacterium]
MKHQKHHPLFHHSMFRRLSRLHHVAVPRFISIALLISCLLTCEPLFTKAVERSRPEASASEADGSNDFSVTFVDVAERAGLTAPTIYGGVDQKKYIIETNGCGVAFFDYDNDGWIDIFLLNGTRLEGSQPARRPTSMLYHNNRNGTFSDVTARSGLDRTGWASAVTVGDYDNDGFDDLFTTYWGQNVLFHNNGNGTFTDVTARSGLATRGTRWGSGCAFVDYDRDGKLDLFVANYLKFDLATAPEPGKGPNCLWKGIPVNCGPKGLPTDTNLLYHNNGDGTFSDVSESSGVGKVRERYAMTAVVSDFNDDGWPDIYVACDSTASILYKNNRDGTFADVAVETGAAYNEDGQAQAGMGVTVGDYNGDGLLDIFKTHFADDLPILYKNSGRGFFEDSSRAAGFDHTRYVQWGTGLEDLDNDGWPDILTVTGNVYPEVEKYFKEYSHRTTRLVYRNLGNGRYKDVTTQCGPGVLTPHSSRGCAFGDFDNDGDIDVLVMNMNEPPSLLRNDYINSTGRGANNWLDVKLIGTKSNRSAIGSRLRLRTAAHLQAQEITSQSSYYSHNDSRLHFGLGPNKKADQLEIRWPSGQTEVIKDIAANQILTIKEGSGIVSSLGSRK